MKVQVLDAATADLADGYRFYERQAEGLGEYVLDSLWSDINSLRLYAGIHGLQHGYHRLLSRKFPYAVYYKIEDSVARVRAILDCRSNPDWISKRSNKVKKNKLLYWVYMVVGTAIITVIATIFDMGKGNISVIGTAVFVLVNFFILVKKSKLYFDEDFKYKKSTRKCFFISCVLSWIFVGFIGFILFVSKFASISFVVPTALISPIFFANRIYHYVCSLSRMNIDNRKSEIISVCIALLVTFNVVSVLLFTFHIYYAFPYSIITFVFDLFGTLFTFFSSLQKVQKAQKEKKSLVAVVLIAFIGLPFAVMLLLKAIQGIAILQGIAAQ